MRLALVHNLDAGDRRYEKGELARLLREADLDVEEFGKKKRDIDRALETRPHVMAVAGGDGTVARVAKALEGTDIPLLIIPAGTSNNIARSLGVSTRLPASQEDLRSAPHFPLDIGHLETAWGDKRFVEAAGVGFLGRMLRGRMSGHARKMMKKRNSKSSRASKQARIAEGTAQFVRDQPVREYEVYADNEDLSGEYLTIEAMNIRAIGPRIVLAPETKPGDGVFDLVLVRQEDREALAEYVAAREKPDALPPLMSRRVRHAKFSWPAKDGHADDRPWPNSSRRNRKIGDESSAEVRLGGCVNVVRLAGAPRLSAP